MWGCHGSRLAVSWPSTTTIRRTLSPKIVTTSRSTIGTARRTFTTTEASNTDNDTIPVHWLNLRGSGLSVLERLLLEECLLKCDDRHWVISGTHEASRHRYLTSVPSRPMYSSDGSTSSPDSENNQNTSTAIVLGLGGKPQELLNVDLVQHEGVMCIKRFTGGGTVVMDPDCIWTTLIFRPSSSSSSDKHRNNASATLPEAFPKPIMEWSADAIFGPLFQNLGKLQTERQQEKQSNNTTATRSPRNMVQPKGRSSLVLSTKSCGFDNSGQTLSVGGGDPLSSISTEAPPQFALRENDYVLGHDSDETDNKAWKKIGGNAQAITKEGFLHHTSFLWNYEKENMDLLTLPAKRPDYRQDREHTDFLAKLGQLYPNLDKRDFILQLQQTLEQQSDIFEVQPASLVQAMEIVNKAGGMQAWLENKSRTRVLLEL